MSIDDLKDEERPEAGTMVLPKLDCCFPSKSKSLRKSEAFMSVPPYDTRQVLLLECRDVHLLGHFDAYHWKPGSPV